MMVIFSNHCTVQYERTRFYKLHTITTVIRLFHIYVYFLKIFALKLKLNYSPEEHISRFAKIDRSIGFLTRPIESTK